MPMKTLLLVLVGLLGSTGLWSQTEGTIKGIVKDEKGNPVIDAAVIYKKDITRGALADENGYYEMNVPVGEAMLICRYSGMIPDTFTVVVEGRRNIDQRHRTQAHRY
jgi:hypothetical protein